MPVVPFHNVLNSALAAMILTNFMARAFQTPPSFLRQPLHQSLSFQLQRTRLLVETDRLADTFEELMGGERYEMVPLPDSMFETTIFVKNVCEFAHDDDLSKLFQSVSALNSVPACVARKADMTSMEYGFVSFPNVQEKEVRACTMHACVTCRHLMNMVA